jgi:hypothetical protein
VGAWAVIITVGLLTLGFAPLVWADWQAERTRQAEARLAELLDHDRDRDRRP